MARTIFLPWQQKKTQGFRAWVVESAMLLNNKIAMFLEQNHVETAMALCKNAMAERNL